MSTPQGATPTDQRPPVAPGDLVGGKYLVDRVLGQGAMGLVVAATHLDLHQLVAIKLLQPSLMENAVSVERFLREARATVQLKSEHVARVLDVGRTKNGVPFMVMEYLEGNDLGAVLTVGGPLAVRDAVDYVLQACEAIAEAHARGIIHRDLKPQNLFVTRRVGGEPLVKVLDFGISKSQRSSLSVLTQMTGFLGSPVYTAPEQVRASRDVDARCDIWSLGVVLQELVTGRLPFEADTVPELTLKIRGEAPRPPELDRPDLPPQLLAIIAHCLQKDPAKRFSDVAELASALQPLASAHSSGLASRAASALGQAERRGATTRDELVSSSGPPEAARVMSMETPHDPTPPRRSSRALVLVLAGATLVGSIFLLRATTREHTPPPPANVAPPVSVVAPSSAEPVLVTPVSPAPAPVVSSAAPAPAPPPKPRRPAPRRPPPSPDDEIPSMR